MQGECLMKKWFAVLPALCLLLSACGAGPAGAAEETAYTPEQLAWAVWVNQSSRPERTVALRPEDPDFGAYLTAYYRLEPEEVEDGYLLYAGGADAFEIAVLRFREEADMAAAGQALRDYRDARAGDFTGYLPEQAAMVEAGTVTVRGRWAALALCPTPEEEAFLACFGSKAPAPETPDWPPAPPDPLPEEPVPPEGSTQAPPAQELPVPKGLPPDTGSLPAPENPGGEAAAPDYDGAAVTAAFRSGDRSGLSEKSLAVLEAAEQALARAVTPEMSPYQQELAVHDWMLSHGQYDHDALSHLSGAETEDSSTPYGFLVQGKGICLGYTSTFRLLMDLLGIECRTVEGTAHNGTADHAWNLVRLDGEWYAVDVTWDDPTATLPVSERTAHRYFNVTSDFLRSNDHQWEAIGVPEAEGTAWAWQEDPPEETAAHPGGDDLKTDES